MTPDQEARLAQIQLGFVAERCAEDGPEPHKIDIRFSMTISGKLYGGTVRIPYPIQSMDDALLQIQRALEIAEKTALEVRAGRWVRPG